MASPSSPSHSSGPEPPGLPIGITQPTGRWQDLTHLPDGRERSTAEVADVRPSVDVTVITHPAQLPYWRPWRQYGSMPNIQIKDVPEETHAVLRQRASAAHQSLQEYLRSRLIAEAAQPTVDEVLARAGGRAGGSLSLADAVSALRFDRARH